MNNMKLNYKIAIVGAIVSTLLSCEKSEVESFDATQSYIYIDKPFVYDSYGRLTTERVKGMDYSFAFDAPEVKSYTFSVPVAVMGLLSDADRSYKVEVVKEKTTATNADWDESNINDVYIKKGELFTSLKVVVKRTSSLTTEAKTICLRLVANDNFVLGDHQLVDIVLTYSDILKEPAWWPKYIRYFGSYQKEVYLKWKDIYYLGADPNINYDNNKQLYWDNMPKYYRPDTYPVMAMYIQILKQYFIDHEVYPGGDTSKPRIILPN